MLTSGNPVAQIYPNGLIGSNEKRISLAVLCRSPEIPAVPARIVRAVAAVPEPRMAPKECARLPGALPPSPAAI